MIYQLELTDRARQHLEEWKKSGQRKTILKIVSLFEELRLHPTTGTGKVEQLKGDLQGFWSRRIDKSSRLIYQIDNQIVKVLIVSLKGHYNDK